MIDQKLKDNYGYIAAGDVQIENSVTVEKQNNFFMIDCRVDCSIKINTLRLVQFCWLITFMFIGAGCFQFAREEIDIGLKGLAVGAGMVFWFSSLLCLVKKGRLVAAIYTVIISK